MISWDESYATGEEKVDHQHRALFHFINKLRDDILSCEPLEDFGDRIRFLADYARTHFSYEESCMHRYRCPAAQKNIDAHKSFLEFYRSFEARLKEEGITPQNLAELHQFIEEWIVGHIKRIDTQLRPCIGGGRKGS